MSVRAQRQGLLASNRHRSSSTHRDSISHRAVEGLEAELVSPASSTSRGVTHSNCVLLTIAGQGSTHSYRYERHRGGEREREREELQKITDWDKREKRRVHRSMHYRTRFHTILIHYYQVNGRLDWTHMYVQCVWNINYNNKWLILKIFILST